MHYFLEYDINDINKLSREEQIQIMKNWFLSNYQDPQNECPYDKEEGDYVYIYGGPYDAREELEGQFDDYVEKIAIDELVDELENQCYEWSGIDFDFNSEYRELIIDPLNNLKNSLDTLGKILEIKGYEEYRDTFFYMITANCITSLEAFLSEFLIMKISNNRIYLRNLIENTKDFKDIKFTMSELFNKYDTIEETVHEYLSNICYHNLIKISKIYEQVFSKTFPKDIGFLYKMIETRHDIIHRNGKKKDGSKVIITKDEISKLFADIITLAEFINENMGKELF
jgi:hypothetical protein